MFKFPVFEPYIGQSEFTLVQKALSEKNISGTSPTVSEFEKKFSSKVTTPHVVAVSNGTVALELALKVCQFPEGSEIIVPNCTIISNALSVIQNHLKPVFIDVNLDDWCLDLTLVERKINSRTRAIMAVDLFGNACDFDSLRELCKRHNLVLIEDAAESMGGFYKDKPLGSLGDLNTFSFYANKLITMGEGGAVGCFSNDLNQKLKVCRNLGFNPDPAQRFIHAELSGNYRLSSLQAAMGIGQLGYWDELVKTRNEVLRTYQDCLKDERRVRFSRPRPYSKSVMWMVAIQLSKDVNVSVEALQHRLMTAGVETRRFFYPLHQQPVLKNYHSNFNDGEFPVSIELFERGLYLPSSPTLTRSDIQNIVDIFCENLD